MAAPDLSTLVQVPIRATSMVDSIEVEATITRDTEARVRARHLRPAMRCLQRPKLDLLRHQKRPNRTMTTDI
jgi:hypothetical protein